VTSPWITPGDVKGYTEHTDVQNRADSKLQIDIRRAEAYIKTYCNNDFKDVSSSEDIRTAAIIVADMFAHNAYQMAKTVESETFDDYSYKASMETIDAASLGLDTLLDPYIKAASKGRTIMNLRAL